MPYAVNLRVMRPAQRQYPHPDVTYLLAVAPHAHGVNVMQLRLSSAHCAALVEGAYPHIPPDVLGELIQRLITRDVMQEAKVDKERDV